jgi:hypothetical protein
MIKFPLLLIRHQSMKRYRGVKVQLRAFLTSALDDADEWLASFPGRFALGERAASTHWIGSWLVSEPVWTLCRREISLSLPGLEP